MKLKLSQLLPFLLLVPMALASSPVLAAGWGKGGGKVKMSELIPKMSSTEAYTERYGFAVDIDGGGHVGVDFTISNLGWGDFHGGVEVRINAPGEKKYKFSKLKDEGEWSSSKKSFKLNIASTSITQVGNNSFRLKHNGKVKCDLLFDNKMPMWHPGNGEIRTDAGYYQLNVIAPRADVTGTITINGKTVKVDQKRGGYADHIATDVAPYDLAMRFSRMRNYNGDIFVIWREVTLTEEFGGRSVTWIMIGYKDKIIFSDSAAKMREGRIKQDPKSGYNYPMSMQIDGKNGKDSIKLVMKGTKKKRKDLMAGYGAAVKMVAGAFTKPVQFDVTCDYTLEMTVGGTTAQVKGKSHFVVDYLNQ